MTSCRKVVVAVFICLLATTKCFHITTRSSMTGNRCCHMTFAVVGATGRTGQRIVKQLVEQQQQQRKKNGIRCLVRSASLSKANDLFSKLPNVEIRTLDLMPDGAVEGEEVESTIENAIKGCETVICALGALESEPLNWRSPYKIDGKLSQSFIAAAAKKTSGVKHYIMVSSLGTDRVGFPASILNLFWGVLNWKRQTELKLVRSGLKYTIVRPGGMERPTDDFEETHNMKLHPPSTMFGGLVSRKQVASLCAAAALNPDLAADRVLEVTADPAYPKRSPVELLEALQPVVTSEKEWRARLSREEFYILREAGTERPWTSALNDEKRAGAFTCAGCGTELFASSSKFESGTGWPSFSSPAVKGAVAERTDFTLGMMRTEVLCGCCGGHLGHVFPDGPWPTGQRYCINGAALKFRPLVPEADPKQDASLRSKLGDRLA